MENENINSPDFDLRKALSTIAGGAGAEKNIPEVISAGLRNFVNTLSPLYNVIPKIDWPTNVYTYRAYTEGVVAGFRQDLGTLPSADDPGYNKYTVPMVYLYARGEVSGPLQDATEGTIDIFAHDIEQQVKGMFRTLNQKIITGDSADNSYEFDGFAKLITNSVAGGSERLTLPKLEEAIDDTVERPTHIILSRAMRRRLVDILRAYNRYDETTIDGGFRVPSFDGLPIIAVDDATTGLTNTIYLPNMNFVKMPIQRYPTYEPLAKTKDSDDFFIRMYCTLAVEGSAYHHTKITAVLP